MMKNTIIIIGLFALVQACNIATLSSNETSGGDTGPVDTIEITNEFPATVEDLTSILTGGESRVWQATGFEVLRISGFQSCRLDDKITLVSDGTYMYDGGSDLCGAEDDARIKTGVWEMDFTGQTLTFDKGTDNQAVAEIATAMDSKLILRGEYFGWDLVGMYEPNI